MLLTRANGGVILVVVLLAAVAAFSMGAATGAQAATNESVDMQNVSATIEQMPSELKQNISENATGAKEDMMLSVAMPTAHAAVFSAKAGMTVGYTSPTAGRFISNVGPMGVLIAVFGYYILHFKRLWKARKQT